jgi:hypothetical protein
MKKAILGICIAILLLGGANLFNTPVENIMQQIYMSTQWANLYLLIITLVLFGILFKDK